MLSLLDSDSEEFQTVEDQFLSTLPHAEVKQIHRIQNRVLWRKYLDKSKEMSDFGGGTLNERFLFHGSRQNNPELIYRGDASFEVQPRWAVGSWKLLCCECIILRWFFF